MSFRPDDRDRPFSFKRDCPQFFNDLQTVKGSGAVLQIRWREASHCWPHLAARGKVSGVVGRLPDGFDRDRFVDPLVGAK
jgi:hypothetical protein